MVKDAVPLGECRRALVLKLRHHGDVLLAAPVPSVLKAHAPQLEVDALVYDDTAPMLEGHPALARLHTVGRKWRELGALERLSRERRLFADLRARGYDLVVHLTEHPRGAWLARLLGARYAVAPRVSGRGAFWRGSFTHFYPIVPRRHMVEVNLDALRRIGVEPALDERNVVFVPGVQAERSVDALLDGQPFVALALQVLERGEERGADRPARRRGPPHRRHRRARRDAVHRRDSRQSEVEAAQPRRQADAEAARRRGGARAALRRRRLDADAPRRGDGRADRRALRPER